MSYTKIENIMGVGTMYLSEERFGKKMDFMIRRLTVPLRTDVLETLSYIHVDIDGSNGDLEYEYTRMCTNGRRILFEATWT